MGNEQWWSNLNPFTQDWLIANNGDAVPSVMAAEVTACGGPRAARRADNDDEAGLFYPDEIVDWIEEIANAEDSPHSL